MPGVSEMLLPKKLKDLENMSPWSILLVVTGATIGLAVFLDRIQKLKSLVEFVVLLGVQPAAPSSMKQELSTWLFLTLLALCVLLIVLSLLYVQAEMRRRRSLQSLDERKTRAYTTLQGMMRAAQRIRTQSYPSVARHKIFKRIHIKYVLDKSFTATVKRSYTIAAIGGPVHFWQESYRVRDAAEATEYLLDIDFKVTDVSGRGDVVYLPTEIDGRSKAVSLYFLPQITPEDEGRAIEITYRWPGLAKSLRDVGEESFNFNYDSLLPVKEIVLEIFLEPGTGGKLEAEIAGVRFPGANITAASEPDSSWPGIRYSCPNSPEGPRVVHSILVKWRKT